MILSVDDYNPRNIEIAQLIKKYGLENQTIFFIECFGAQAQEQIKELDKMGFIIGSHTMLHTILTRTTLEQAEWEIKASKELLEKLIGKEIEWFAYVRGYYNKDILKMVKEAGYKYARTTLLKDGETDLEKGGIHISFPRKEYDGKDPFGVALASDMKHYWLHVKELFYHKSLGEFEEFIKKLIRRESQWKS